METIALLKENIIQILCAAAVIIGIITGKVKTAEQAKKKKEKILEKLKKKESKLRKKLQKTLNKENKIEKELQK